MLFIESFALQVSRLTYSEEYVYSLLVSIKHFATNKLTSYSIRTISFYEDEINGYPTIRDIILLDRFFKIWWSDIYWIITGNFDNDRDNVLLLFVMLR